MSGQRVVVAMSGGVDSSVAAYLLKAQGYEVLGITMRLRRDSDAADSNAPRRFSRCCSTQDVYDARAVAQALGIPHYTWDLAAEFQAGVIDYFTESYLRGETPNPCLACNDVMKFDVLLQRALAVGAEALATGHYARIDRLCQSRHARRSHNDSLGTPQPKEVFLLKKARDVHKDQSYVLYHLTQDQLAKLRFPVGDYSKDDIRRLAKDAGLRTADKPDSQDICFLDGGDYRPFVQARAPEGAIRPGAIRDRAGRVLGQHHGMAFYTVGQRKGLGFSAGRPMYVVGLEPDTNTVIVGEKEEGLSKGCLVRSPHWVADEAPSLPCRAAVKIRYQHVEAPATLSRASDGGLSVGFDCPQPAVTPGQAAVFYEGDAVLGGGIIAQAEPA